MNHGSGEVGICSDTAVDHGYAHAAPEALQSAASRLDAFDGTRNFLFTRLRKADEGSKFQVNRANLVKLDAAVKFPPLWSRKAMPPASVFTVGSGRLPGRILSSAWAGVPSA